jgi:hypothetical protein
VRHYRNCDYYLSGSQGCTKGVVVKELRDSELRLPCVVVDGVTGSKSCALLKISQAPESAAAGTMQAQLALLLKELCPKCGQEMTSTQEVENRIHAMPCRHVIRGEIDAK